jgi:hypothetical protein
MKCHVHIFTNILLKYDIYCDRAVGIATGYGFGWPRGRSSSPGRGQTFLLSGSSRPVQGPYPMGIGGSFLRGIAAGA